MDNSKTPNRKVHRYEDGVWKAPEMDLPPDYFKWSERLLPTLKRSPDFIGQIDGVTGEEDSFGAMADRSVRCALWLKSQGIQPGDVVTYCSKNHLDSCIVLLGTVFTGAIFNSWTDSLKEDLVEYFAELTEPKVVFADESAAKTILTVKPDTKLVVFGKMDGIESFDDILSQQDPDEVERFKPFEVKSPDVPAFITFTSGTTGRPKGVLRAYGSMRIVFNNEQHRGIDEDKPKIGMWFATLSWLSPIICSFDSVLCKSTSIIHNEPDEVELSKMMQKYKVTWFAMGTGIVNRFYSSKAVAKYDFSSVINVWIGGAVISSAVEDYITKLFPNATLGQIYGSTEFLGISNGPYNVRKPATVGRVALGVELKTVDPITGKVLGHGESGEFHVRGIVCMIGYWKNPEATKKAVDSEGWYHTGDYGYYDEDGFIWVLDRLSLLIRYKHHLVPSTAIESAIRLHPGVYNVGVVGKPHDEDTEHAVAFVTRQPDSKVTEQEILEFVKGKLPESMWPHGGVVFPEKMPYTFGGKICKSDLQVLANGISR